MSEVKPVSFRINEEDQEKFKQFASENNLNQAEAFSSIISMIELENARKNLGDRAKSIDVFRDTVSKLVNFYVNSLEENSTAEDRIREEFQKELNTKDNTITNLYEQLQELKMNNTELEKKYQEKYDTLKEAEKAIMGWAKHTDELKKDLEDKQKSIDVLTNNNINQLEQLEQYKDLKSTNDLLLKQLEELESKSLSLENTNKQLSDKIINTEDMINFYKDNMSELKRDIEAYKEDIKDLDIKHGKYIEELETKHNRQIEDIKADYEKSLEKEKVTSEQYREDLNRLDEKYNNQIKEIKSEYENTSKKAIESIREQLINKYDLQLDKKDLEIEKLKNELDQLKSENTKTDKKVKDK